MHESFLLSKRQKSASGVCGGSASGVCGGKQTQESLVKLAHLGPCELAKDKILLPDARKSKKDFKFRFTLSPVDTVLFYPPSAQEAGACSQNSIVSISFF